jgi:hypothetical protein
MFQKGGFLHPEIQIYMPAYLSDKPLMNIIYDSKTLDENNYQARELSYLFDYFDNHFIALCTHFGFPHFLSITYYVFAFLIALGIFRFSLDDLHLNITISLCLVVLFWTSTTVFTSGLLFRSAKIGVTLCLTYGYILLYRLIQNKEKINLWSMLKLFCIAMAMMLFDRQGFYLALMALAFIILWSIFRQENKKSLAFPLLISIFVDLLYNYIIAPRLTHSLNGYWPNFGYQSIDFSDFFLRPGYYLVGSVSLFIDTWRFIFGNIPAFIAVCIPIALLIYLIFFKRDPILALIVLVMIALTMGMIVLMVIRHPPLITNGIGYYWIPTTLLILLTLASFLVDLQGRPVIYTKGIILLVVICIIGNCIPIPGTCRSIHSTNHMYADAALVIQALRMEKGSVVGSVNSYPAYKALHVFVDYNLQQFVPIRYAIKLDNFIKRHVCQ